MQSELQEFGEGEGALLPLYWRPILLLALGAQSVTTFWISQAAFILVD